MMDGAFRSRLHNVDDSRNQPTQQIPPYLYFSSQGHIATSEHFPLPLGGVVGPSSDCVSMS